MTATKTNLSAFGLTLLILAAVNAAFGQTAACGVSGCESGCEAGCPANGQAGPAQGFRAEDFNHEPCCRYASESPCLEEDPIFGRFAPYVRDCCETWAGCTLKADAEVLLLHREAPGSAPLLLDPNSGATLYDAGRLQFPYSGGQRISLTALDCEGWGVEVNYFGIDSWSFEQNLPDLSGTVNGGVANLVADSVIQVPLSSVLFQSTSFLYSVEINARKPLFGNIGGLIGFRWLDLTDRLLALGTRDTGDAVAEFVQTRNHLFGVQIGADGAIKQVCDRVCINGFVKAGVFYNNANQETALSDPAGNGMLSVSNDQKQAAFFGEAGFVGCVQVTQHLTARAGYKVMYVNGVGQPGNQLAGTNLAAQTATLDTNSSILYHGANFGLEVVW